MNKKSRIIISSILFLLFLIIILWRSDLFKRTVSYDGNIFAAVESEIIIDRDKNGIPFIKAESITDAYFAIGFLHGKDRMILIEYFRAIASGRLSELVGEKGTSIDKLTRTLSFVKKTDELIQNLNKSHTAYLNSYVKGINAAKHNYYNDISQFSHIPSSPWTTNEVLSILLLFEWADSFLNNKELLFPFPESLSGHSLRNIIPDDLNYNYSLQEERDVTKLLDIKKTVKNYIGTYTEGLAFYIGGGKVLNGKSIVGFNLDCGMSLYPKWYPLHIDTGEYKIACITSSGLPFIQFGNNGSITFLGFNLKVDTQDLCIEKTKKSNGTVQYLSRGKWKNFKISDETIYLDKEHEEDNQIKMLVRDSDTGPIISDIFNGDRINHFLSLKSLQSDESYIASLFEIPFSKSLPAAQRRIKNIFSMPRVYLFAAKDKAIVAYSGKVPKRNIKNNI